MLGQRARVGCAQVMRDTYLAGYASEKPEAATAAHIRNTLEMTATVIALASTNPTTDTAYHGHNTRAPRPTHIACVRCSCIIMCVLNLDRLSVQNIFCVDYRMPVVIPISMSRRGCKGYAISILRMIRLVEYMLQPLTHKIKRVSARSSHM